MKSIKVNLLMLILCSLITVTAFAGGDTGWRKIENINQRSCAPNQGLQISFTQDHKNPDVCTSTRAVEVSCSLSTYKQILAIALTAKMGNREVAGNVGGCDSEGQAMLRTLRFR